MVLHIAQHQHNGDRRTATLCASASRRSRTKSLSCCSSGLSCHSAIAAARCSLLTGRLCARGCTQNRCRRPADVCLAESRCRAGLQVSAVNSWKSGHLRLQSQMSYVSDMLNELSLAVGWGYDETLPHLILRTAAYAQPSLARPCSQGSGVAGELCVLLTDCCIERSACPP